MKKILASFGSIIFVSAMLIGGTGAFLIDKEKSTGNTFASGVIDLKVDNESYITNEDGKLVFSPATSWELSGLSGKLFFNFLDVKPGDIGEDTISLHVNNNNAWMCMSVTLTGTPENEQTEPEMLVDSTGGVQQGELQNTLEFAFWADDGDNVFERREDTFREGLVKDIFNGKLWTLADSDHNIWSGEGAPIPGNSIKYIGKAWCYGNLTKTPLPQDGMGKTGSNGPLVRGTGFDCDGDSLGNEFQSDGIKADVTFEAVQARGNESFICGETREEEPSDDPILLFFDNFESCQLGMNFHPSWNSNWVEEGGVQAIQVGGEHKKIVDLDAGKNEGSTNHKEVITSKSIDMTLYEDITLKYDRKMDDTNSPTQPLGLQTLKVEFSTNGGGSWTTIETVTGESDWTGKSFSLSPGADHKSNVKIRFSLTGVDNTNHAYIDNVMIRGQLP
jgi:hypothetical protein